LSESYLQGSGGGVIKVTGTINLQGLYRPNPGDVVYLAASDGQRWISRIPRKLRVLSSFADPLRGVTTVSVGCKFAYFENRKAPLKNPNVAESNPAITAIERAYRTLTISAAFVTSAILEQLGLTAASAIPFTNQRIADEWDLSAGYVQELAKIAESECFRCRLNEDEQVVFISLNQGLAVAPLLTEQQIIDLTPQTIGELPAEAVYASYQTTQLKPPDPNANDENKIKQRNWEREESLSIQQYIHSGPDKIERGTFTTSRVSVSSYDLKDRLVKRVETTTGLMGQTIGTTEYEYKTPISAAPGSNIIYPKVLKPDDTIVIRESFEQTSPRADIAGSCGFEGSVQDFRALGTYISSRRIVEFDRDVTSGITKTTTRNFVPFVNTPFGSDAIQKSTFDTDVFVLLNIAGSLTEYGSEINIRTEREFGFRRRPSQQERNRSQDQKEPPSVQVTNFVWDTGSATTQTRLELSPPYTPDDKFTKTIVNGSTVWTLTLSDAPQKALNYARIENKLLLANRSGAGIQIRLIDAPVAPFDLFYLRFNDCTAAYRVNGMTWTISTEGIVVSIDALFWGAIDGNINNAWFPLAPGVSSLPALNVVTTNNNPLPPNAIAIPEGFDPLNVNLSTLFALLPTNQPPVFAATLNPSAIIQPYSETLFLDGGVNIGATIEAMPRDNLAIYLYGGVNVGVMTAPELETRYLVGGVQVGAIQGDPESTLSIVFLLQMTGSNGSTTFTDLSANAIPVTAYGNAQINNNELLLDGNGDYLLASGSALSLPDGTNDRWTIEGFLTPDGTNIDEFNTLGILSLLNTTGSVLDFFNLGISEGNWAVGVPDLYSIGIQAVANTRVHFAMVYNGSTDELKTYIDGVLGDEYIPTTGTSIGGAQPDKLSIGRFDPNGLMFSDYDFSGRIGPIRITLDEVYTENFTPPTSFPNP
jgi:hypothetical protein